MWNNFILALILLGFFISGIAFSIANFRSKNASPLDIVFCVAILIISSVSLVNHVSYSGGDDYYNKIKTKGDFLVASLLNAKDIEKTAIELTPDIEVYNNEIKNSKKYKDTPVLKLFINPKTTQLDTINIEYYIDKNSRELQKITNQNAIP